MSERKKIVLQTRVEIDCKGKTTHEKFSSRQSGAFCTLAKQINKIDINTNTSKFVAFFFLIYIA